MHYTGTIWRPPYEAGSLLIEATAGCTHHRCKFCNLYDGLPYPFRMAPLEQIEADLLEVQMELRRRRDKPQVRRVFLVGGNPFALEFKRLRRIGELIRQYFPECRSVGCFARVTDITRKTDWELGELKKLGYRMKFPAKTGDLSRRWCSAYLKIMVADTVMSNLSRLKQLEELGGKRHMFPAKGGTHQGRWCSGNLKAAVQDSVTSNLEKTRANVKVLVVSGERRGESSGRAKYNEMEIHRTNAEAKAHRLVHQWRPVIDYSEKDVWELLKRHNVNPHPCYRAGWNRCSCAMCIFSTPKLFAGIRELYPEDYGMLRQDEKVLGFTLDNDCDLDTFIGNVGSCVYHGDKEAIHSLVTGEFSADSVYVQGEWKYPAGAFHGAEGGPC